MLTRGRKIFRNSFLKEFVAAALGTFILILQRSHRRGRLREGAKRLQISPLWLLNAIIPKPIIKNCDTNRFLTIVIGFGYTSFACAGFARRIPRWQRAPSSRHKIIKGR